MRFSRPVSLSLALLLLASAPALSGELAGVEMSDEITVGDQELVLNGMGLRSKLMFKVYVAGLYLPEATKSAEAIFGTDGTRHLAMHWLRKVGKEDICGGWDEGLAANTPQATPELKKQFKQLCGYMADAQKGQIFTFTYVPGTGTTVQIGQKEVGTIEGKEFADALWACWIGPKPGPGEEFKADLLGG